MILSNLKNTTFHVRVGNKTLTQTWKRITVVTELVLVLGIWFNDRESQRDIQTNRRTEKRADSQTDTQKQITRDRCREKRR